MSHWAFDPLAGSPLLLEEAEPAAVISRRTIAHNLVQEVRIHIDIPYPVLVAGTDPILARLVKAHDFKQKEMQAFSLLPIADEEPPEPPILEADVPPISQVISSGAGW